MGQHRCAALVRRLQVLHTASESANATGESTAAPSTSLHARVLRGHLRFVFLLQVLSQTVRRLLSADGKVLRHVPPDAVQRRVRLQHRVDMPLGLDRASTQALGSSLVTVTATATAVRLSLIHI